MSRFCARMTMAALSTLAIVSTLIPSATAVEPPEPVRFAEITATPAPPVPFEVVPGDTDALPVIPPDAPAGAIYQPRMADQDDETAPLGRSQRELIEYDLLTRTERRWKVDAPSDPATRFTRGGEGDPMALRGREQELPPSSKDFSGLSFVFDPSSGHYPKHVKIKTKYRDENNEVVNSGCSGTLIDPKHVLTAGHCIFKWEDEDGDTVESFPFEATVYPGYHHGDAGPWGPVKGINFYSWAEWTDDEDLDYDVGIIELDRPIGGVVGWRSYGTSSNCDYFEGGSWVRIGYPGESFSGNYQYEQTGDYDDCDTNAFGWYGNNLQYDRFVYKGQSGSGAVRDGVAWAVASHRDGLGTSHDTRIWPEAFDDIVAYIDSHVPATRDLHALDVEVSSTGGLAGNPLGDLSFVVHNYSKEEGSFFVSYTVYMSTDDVINQSDTYVTSGSFSHDFGRNGSIRVNVPSTFVPSELTNGDYRIGIVLTQPDANDLNNDTAKYDQEVFTVECATQGIPQPAFPVDGHPCVPTTVTINWGSVPGIGVDYELNIWPSGGLAQQYSTSSTGILMSNLTPGTTYGWQVRAKTDCGAYSAWSNAFFFTTSGLLSPAILTNPKEDERCVPTTVTLQWDPVPNASVYRIRFGLDGQAGTEYYTTQSSYTLSGLVPQRRYLWSVTPADACGIYTTTGAAIDFVTGTDLMPDAPTLDSPVQYEAAPALATLTMDFERYGQEYEWELQTLAGVPVDAGTEASLENWVVGPLPVDDYRWRARYLQCVNSGSVWSPWSAWESFWVDAQAPTFQQSPIAIFPPVGQWTNSDLVNVEFYDATDDCCIAAYWIAWDQEPDTVPDGSISSTTTGGWESNLPEGSNWFHVVAVDDAGNVSAAEHLGPFLIDLSPPSVPVPTANIAPLIPANVPDIHVSWPASDDPLSGVAGYSVEWSQSVATVVDQTIDTTGSTSDLMAVPEGVHYFYIRSVDAVGNASEQLQLRYYIDRTPPMMMIFQPYGGQVLQQNQPFWVDYNVNDNFGQNGVVIAHSYSVDGGSYWYEIHCGGNPGPGQSGCAQRPFQWRVPWVPPQSQVLYRITGTDQAGNVGETISDPFWVNTSTGTDGLPSIKDYALLGNAPNPFNPRTTIRYALPEAAEVRLDILDLRGKRIRTLVSERQNGPAEHTATWNGVDDHGNPVASGVYLYRLQAGEFVDSGRMALLK